MHFSKKSNSNKDKKTNSKKSSSHKEKIETQEEDKKIEEKGYGADDNIDEDFDENMIEENLDSNKQTQTSKFSRKISNHSSSSKNSLKKKYYYGKYGTKANFISLQRFHNKAGRTNVDNDGIPLDIINEEEEREKALVAFTRLSVSTCVFFCYNLKVRHILFAPFLNLTLFNNRWKKLMVLLTQFYIQQIIISLLLTVKEDITMDNISGIIIVAFISIIIANII